MATTRAVFFDLVGTLVDVDGGVGEQYAALARRENFDLDPERVNQAFPLALRGVPLVDWGPGTTQAQIAVREKVAWRAIVRRITAEARLPAGEPVPDFDSYFELLYEHFTTRQAWVVHPDVVPCLEDLLSRGYVVGLVTNFDLRAHRLLDNLDLTRLFDSITVPADAAAAKPDAAIFSFALARHSLLPDEAVYVGDSPGDDVEGAGRAGLRPVLVDRRNTKTDIANVPRIASLDRLRDVLQGTPDAVS